MTFHDTSQTSRRLRCPWRGRGSAAVWPEDLGNHAQIVVACSRLPEREWRISADSAAEKRLRGKKMQCIDQSV